MSEDKINLIVIQFIEKFKNIIDITSKPFIEIECESVTGYVIDEPPHIHYTKRLISKNNMFVKEEYSYAVHRYYVGNATFNMEIKDPQTKQYVLKFLDTYCTVEKQIS